MLVEHTVCGHGHRAALVPLEQRSLRHGVPRLHGEGGLRRGGRAAADATRRHHDEGRAVHEWEAVGHARPAEDSAERTPIAFASPFSELLW